ncbi:DUF3549 family protein [Bowmanella dokdonensis]|uniref:DUF3549 family protein n=1 Tax=Bowmanella dokdonensis TaxID=751969 RepID=A0A939DLB8_9ALTE|nr:DUF3549 family protein [Bowmanella dokdonensis]MBN7824838.1 DUF3549 family protein [Bowmanella dokdonensis]
MTVIDTLSEFLLQSGCQYRIYDLGRGIRPLNSQTFLEIENNQRPHPYPRLGQAWLAVLFWNKQLSSQHYIWFLKLPLDEQGMLVLAARNQFLHMVVELLGKQIQEKKLESLPDHPFSFVPGQQQMADFNAQVRHALKLPAAEQLGQALAYLREPELHHWQSVPLQGLADMVVRAGEPSVQTLLLENFPRLAQPVQVALMQSLESQTPGIPMTECVIALMRNNPDDHSIQLAGLRALSRSTADGLVEGELEKLLAPDNAPDADLLITISGRHWHRLEKDELLRPYLEKLAQQPADLFGAVFADLVRIPCLRNKMLAALRSTDKSPGLTRAIGQLFSEKAQ